MSDALVRRAVVVGADGIRVETEAMPELADGHVRVALAFAGICHSDIAAIAGGDVADGSRIGHEASGVVVASRADGIAVGDRVVAYVGDAYATHVDAPADRVVPLDEGCSLLDAALAEPVACVIGGVEMLELTHLDEVVLVGAGFMGLLAVRYLALLGHRVTVVEPVARRRELAVELGAARAVEPDAARGMYPDGASLVVEATGAAGGLALASDLCAIGATLGILGYHQSGGGERTVPMESWNFRALKVLSLHHRDPANVLRWIDRAQRSAARGGIVPSALVDAQLPLDDAPLGLRAVPASEAPVKAVLVLS